MQRNLCWVAVRLFYLMYVENYSETKERSDKFEAVSLLLAEQVAAGHVHMHGIQTSY